MDAWHAEMDSYQKQAKNLGINLEYLNDGPLQGLSHLCPNNSNNSLYPRGLTKHPTMPRCNGAGIFWTSKVKPRFSMVFHLIFQVYIRFFVTTFPIANYHFCVANGPIWACGLLQGSPHKRIIIRTAGPSLFYTSH